MANPLAGVGAYASSHPLIIAGGAVGAFALVKALTTPTGVDELAPGTPAAPSTPGATLSAGGTPAAPAFFPGGAFPSLSDPSSFVPSVIPTGPQDFADIRDALTDALAQIGVVPAPVPVVITPPAPVVTPAPVGCGPRPATLGIPGDWVCVGSEWQWVFFAPAPTPTPTPTPAPTPAPAPTPTPTPTPAPTPAPAPTPTPAPSLPPYPPGTWAWYQVPATTLRDFGVSGSTIISVRSIAVAGLRVPVAAPAMYYTRQIFRLADGSVIAANTGFELVRVIGGATYSGGWSGHYLSTRAGRATITRV